MTKAEKLIESFNLQPHPEGGWYRQTYKANEKFMKDGLPKRFSGDRSCSTAIYYLLEKDNYSAFHRIKSDECWHFYDGGQLEIYILEPGGKLKTVLLGKSFEAGQVFQFVVPAGCWFACCPSPGNEFCFAGCTVSPGFEFEDFELANAKELSEIYPQHKNLIGKMCR